VPPRRSAHGDMHSSNPTNTLPLWASPNTHRTASPLYPSAFASTPVVACECGATTVVMLPTQLTLLPSHPQSVLQAHQSR
jgi:hypothetical protein